MSSLLIGIIVGIIITVSFYELTKYEKENKKMAGTIAGGKSAAKTNKKRYGEDFYENIGAVGGRKGKTGGFYVNRDLARIAGAKGGRKSRRGKK